MYKPFYLRWEGRFLQIAFVITYIRYPLCVYGMNCKNSHAKVGNHQKLLKTISFSKFPNCLILRSYLLLPGCRLDANLCILKNRNVPSAETRVMTFGGRIKFKIKYRELSQHRNRISQSILGLHTEAVRQSKAAFTLKRLGNQR